MIIRLNKTSGYVDFVPTEKLANFHTASHTHFSGSHYLGKMDVDDVLVTIGMGRYQVMGCFLFGIVLLMSNVSPVAYIFTAGDLKYR